MVWAILNSDHSTALHELIEGQHSDRIVAVVGGAMLDDSLRRTLEQRLRPKSGKTDINDTLFRPGGPLGNLAPKIDLAHQLYVLDRPQWHALHGLGAIRNMFAHNLSMIFDAPDKKLTEHFAKLTLHDGLTHYPSPIWGDPGIFPLEPTLRRRDVFFVNLKLSLLLLMADIHKHVPWSNEPTGVTYAAPDGFTAPEATGLEELP